jgi:hypothetical protein
LFWGGTHFKKGVLLQSFHENGGNFFPSLFCQLTCRSNPKKFLYWNKPGFGFRTLPTCRRDCFSRHIQPLTLVTATIKLTLRKIEVD